LLINNHDDHPSLDLTAIGQAIVGHQIEGDFVSSP
jgi:hypothetical protein